MESQDLLKLMEVPEKIRHIAILADRDKLSISVANSLRRKTKQSTIILPKREYIRSDNIRETNDTIVECYGSSISFNYASDLLNPQSEDPYLINIIHNTLSKELISQDASVLNVIDGTLLIVDSTATTLSTQFETMLPMLAFKLIKPALIISAFEQLISQYISPNQTLESQAEMIYQHLVNIIDPINKALSALESPEIGRLDLYPNQGNVAFASEEDGWAFTLTTFAKIYSKKFNIDAEKLRNKFWGDNFYDPRTKIWLNDPKAGKSSKGDDDGKGEEPIGRAFCAFVMNPILKLYSSILQSNTEQFDKMMATLEITLEPSEKKLEGSALLKAVMSKWLSAADNLLEMVVLHLPSPKVAQKYRIKSVLNNEKNYAVNEKADEITSCFRECDPKGPLIVYVWTMAPTNSNGRFLALGRVFGGTLTSGEKVKIMCPTNGPGNSYDVFENCNAWPGFIITKFLENIKYAASGNLVGLNSLDKIILNTASITTSGIDCFFNEHKSIRSPIIYTKVEPKNPSDLPKMVHNMKYLTRIDRFVVPLLPDTGEYLLAASDESHIDRCLERMQTDYKIQTSDKFVSYKEIVKRSSVKICIAKSANKHNLLYGLAEPISNELTTAIEAGKITPDMDFKNKTQILVDEFGWDPSDTLNLWALGPDHSGPNVLVNVVTTEVRFVNEIRDAMMSGFEWAMKEGVLAGENMRSVRMNLIDVSLHSDVIHRGGGQIIPAARRLFHGCQLTAEPTLQEPMYLFELNFLSSYKDVVYSLLAAKRVSIIEEEETTLLSSWSKLKGYLPVVESFGMILSLFLNS